jgi:hypothetical protein
MFLLRFFEIIAMTIVTHPMLQRRLINPTELRLMDSYIQIFCRVQKCNQKVPPTSPPCTKKNLPLPPKG